MNDPSMYQRVLYGPAMHWKRQAGGELKRPHLRMLTFGPILACSSCNLADLQTPRTFLWGQTKSLWVYGKTCVMQWCGEGMQSVPKWSRLKWHEAASSCIHACASKFCTTTYNKVALTLNAYDAQKETTQVTFTWDQTNSWLNPVCDMRKKITITFAWTT